MKFSWIRITAFLTMMLLTVALAINWGNALIYKEIAPGEYEQLLKGYSYITESGEKEVINFYAGYEFAVECDGEIIKGEENGLLAPAYYKYKRVEACQRIVVLAGSPTIFADSPMTGIDIHPFNNQFAMTAVVLVGIILWGGLSFYFIE